MKVTEIGFKGYKAFTGGDDASIQTLQLAPLTLVFGKNNSGKSAAIRLPKLILGGIECDDGRILPTTVRDQPYGLGFLDLVHGGDFFGRPAFSVRATQDLEELDLTVTLYSRGALTSDEAPLIWSYEMRSPDHISIVEPLTHGQHLESFGGLLPSGPRWDTWRKGATALLDAMVHLGPIRQTVAPTLANEAFSGLSRDGAGAANLLRLDGALSDAVSRWYAEHMDGWRLQLKKDSDSFSLRLTRGSSLSTNLAQAGEGLQQVLPVVTHQLWRQSQSGYFLDIVEQPELHLHAAAQAPLADLFIETALVSSGSTLVETNSEGILLRTQRRIAEGRIKPEDVALYFVDGASERGSCLRRIEISQAGELDWWPEGVFEEDFNEVAAIRRAQKQRHPQRAT